jgi:hypothetical protein
LAIKRKCWKCGQTGHAKKDCPESGSGNNNNGNNGKPIDKCSRCGKDGHTTKDCWYDPNNARKRPAWMKNQESHESLKVSNIGVSRNRSNGNFELLRCAVCYDAPNTVDLIDDVESGFELPNDIVIEKFFMEPIITPATETPTVATKETKPKGGEEEQTEDDDEAYEDAYDEDEVKEEQPEEEEPPEGAEQHEVYAMGDETQDAIEIQDEEVDNDDAVQDNEKVEDDDDIDVHDEEVEDDGEVPTDQAAPSAPSFSFKLWDLAARSNTLFNWKSGHTGNST